MINATGARFCSNCSNALSNGLSSQTQYSNSSPNTLYGDTGNNPYPFTRETSNAPYTPINNPYAPTGNPYGQGTAPPPPPDDPSTATKPKPPYWTRRKLIIVGAGAAAATGLGAYLLTRPTPITLSFNYSTEKEDWMQGAIDDFNQSNTKIDGKPIQIQGTPLGSGDAVTQILDGKIKPAAWSPASDLELNQLINGWKKRHGDQDIIYSSGDMGSLSLFQSPLVFAVWKDRSDVLKAKYKTIDWPSVHDALQSDWSSIGGEASWGPVKFGQTRPDKSNSGLLSITLLAYSFFYSKNSTVLSVDKIQNAAFLKHFAEVQDHVSKFGTSSKTYMEKQVIVEGPLTYDIVTTYENLILTLQNEVRQSQPQLLIPFYPSLNIVSNHPFAIFTNASQEEQKAAQKFRDFLLDVPQQRKALLAGFRPYTKSGVSLHDPISRNPFNDTPPDFQVPDQLPAQVLTPHGDVIDELIKQWKTKYDGVTTVA